LKPQRRQATANMPKSSYSPFCNSEMLHFKSDSRALFCSE
jgi:hypothetical protein